MSHDDVERILADEEQIRPSSRLLTSVMEAVQREAAAPRRAAFPWIRVLPGILAAITSVAVAIWQGLGLLGDPATAAALDAEFRSLTILAADFGLQWIMLAVAVTIVSVLLPLNLARIKDWHLTTPSEVNRPR